MKNYKLVLSYDGSRYRGWQKQGNTENTIQQKLETLLSRLLSQQVELAGSGRTDAGVHARRQVCSFRAEGAPDCEALLAELRRYLPEDISAVSLNEAEPRFHARLSCREKVYVYNIWNSQTPNVFLRHFSLFCPDKLDEEAMRRAGALLLGEHDFSAFCSAHRMKRSARRELRSIELCRNAELLSIKLRGSGFLYNMVRIIVGTLLEVGRGEREAESLSAVLAGRDRKAAGPTAPAHGLILWDALY